MIFRLENGTGYFVFIDYPRKLSGVPRGTTKVKVFDIGGFDRQNHKVASLVKNEEPLAEGKSKCHNLDLFRKRNGLVWAAKRAFRKLKFGFRWDEELHAYCLFRQTDGIDVVMATSAKGTHETVNK